MAKEQLLRVSGLAVLIAMTSALVFSAVPARADRPVPRKIEGCVVSGEFISQRVYRIRVRWARDRQPVNLSPYEGARLRFSGNLLPGDIFFVTSRPTVIGRCRPERQISGNTGVRHGPAKSAL